MSRSSSMKKVHTWILYVADNALDCIIYLKYYILLLLSFFPLKKQGLKIKPLKSILKVCCTLFNVYAHTDPIWCVFHCAKCIQFIYGNKNAVKNSMFLRFYSLKL